MNKLRSISLIFQFSFVESLPKKISLSLCLCSIVACHSVTVVVSSSHNISMVVEQYNFCEGFGLQVKNRRKKIKSLSEK